ncbi:RNA polymerase sigma factor [Enterococcus olivae]
MNSYSEEYLLRTANELIAYLRKIGARLPDAQDIAQETLLKILEIETEIPPDKVHAWMFRVGTNLYFNLYKQTKRRQEILERDFPRIPEEWSSYNEQLFIALNQLDLKAATVLILKYSEERSMKEMAFLLGRPESSLKTELYRARKKLKKILEELTEDGR